MKPLNLFFYTFLTTIFQPHFSRAESRGAFYEADSIDTRAKKLSKYVYSFSRRMVAGGTVDEMLKDYALLYGRADQETLVIEHFPKELGHEFDYLGLIDVGLAIEILEMPLPNYSDAQRIKIKNHFEAILEFGGNIAYTTNGGMSCEESWPSVLVIDPSKKIITELITIQVDC